MTNHPSAEEARDGAWLVARIPTVCLVVLATCHWLIEIRGWRRGTGPFAVLGVNALAVFFLSTLLTIVLTRTQVWSGGRLRSLQAVLFDALFTPWAAPANASLAWACAMLLVWVVAFWPLGRRGIRLAV